jgi:cobalt/nickel transport system permease protein
MPMLPDWMKEVDKSTYKFDRVRAGRKSFIKKTLDGIFSFFEETVSSEGYSHRKGLLQGLDPRVKLISIVALIIAVSMTTDLRLLLMVYLLTLVFAYASRIGVWFFIKRVWLFIPIFSGVIALPMIFNVLQPGDILLTLLALGPGAHIGPIALPETIAVTRQGVIGAVIFTLRVATCVSAAVLLFLTTPRDALFKSLRSIGVPRIYVLTLDMCYRYIFLFMDMIRDFYTAKKSRSLKSLPLGEEQKWVGGRIGYTLVKSIDMGEKVHQAMVSRGFKGDVRLMQDFRMQAKDYAAGMTTLAFSLLLILIAQNIIRL